jgi:pilus assembly protein CpaE
VELTRRLRANQRLANLPIIMLSAKVQTDEILAGYAEGADEYVPKPIEMRVLAAKVESLLRRAVQPATATSAPVALPEPEPPAKQVIVFLHGKGGVGTTTLAVNVGVALATTAHRQVSLLDLGLPYGDVPSMLGLPVDRTLADLGGAMGGASSEALAELVLHHRSGVRVITACDRPDRVGDISGLLVRWAIERMLETSDVVLIDTATWWSEATLAALAAATTVCVVTAPRFLAMKTTATCLAALEKHGLTDDQVRLVLNSTSSRGMKPDEVARRLGHSVDLVVPYLTPFADASRSLRPLDRGQTDQVSAIVARDLASQMIGFAA